MEAILFYELLDCLATIHERSGDFLERMQAKTSWKFRTGYKKLSLLAHKFRTWNRDVFGNQDSRLWELQDKIHKLEEEMKVRDLSETERIELYALNRQQWDVSKHVEAIWRQKSRKNWCKLGDRNTKFFHLAAKVRTSRDYITKITHDGITHNTPQGIKNVVVSFFSMLFSKPKTARVSMGAMG